MTEDTESDPLTIEGHSGPGRPDWRTAGLLLVGHGAVASLAATRILPEHAQALQKQGLFAAVAAGFLKGTPPIEAALGRLTLSRIYVVPFFMSDGHFVRNMVPERLRLEGPLTRRLGREIRYCAPIGTAPALADAVAARLSLLAEDQRIALGETEIVLVAHGSATAPASSEAAERLRARLAELAPARDFHIAYLEQPPVIEHCIAALRSRCIIIVGLFAADGRHADEDVRRRLGFRSGAYAAVRPDGRKLLYTGAIGAEPAMLDIVLERVEAFDRAHGLRPAGA